MSIYFGPIDLLASAFCLDTFRKMMAIMDKKMDQDLVVN